MPEADTKIAELRDTKDFQDLRTRDDGNETTSSGINYEDVLVGFGRRTAALAVDVALLSGLLYAMGRGAYDVFAGFGEVGRLFGFAVCLTYFGTLNSRVGNGQTIGKWLTGIAVRDVDGQRISLIRSMSRFALLGAPFFLYDLSFPTPLTVTSVGQAVVTLNRLLVYGLGVMFLYLFLFNLPSRRTVHDYLTRTWVVEADRRVGTLNLPAAWVGHAVMLMVLFVTTAGVVVAVPSIVKESPVYRELPEAELALEDRPVIQSASVVSGRYFNWQQLAAWDQGEPYLMVTLRCLEGPSGDDSLARDAAAAVLTRYPLLESRDRLTVKIRHGFDFGLAWSFTERTYSRSPAEWL